MGGDREDGGVGRRDRRDDRRDFERRENSQDQDQNRGEQELQEGDSLSALKVILAKVAALLKPLQLNSDEANKIIEQLYGSILEMDSKLAGESDDTRKAAFLAYIKGADIRREGGQIVIDHRQSAPAAAPPVEGAQEASAPEEPAPRSKPNPRPPRERSKPRAEQAPKPADASEKTAEPTQDSSSEPAATPGPEPTAES
jgi:hypothetical protein